MGAAWKTLSPTTRIAIIVGAIGGFVIVAAAVTFCCIRSTRKGLREHEKAEVEWEAQQKEAAQWQRKYQYERSSTSGSGKSRF
jgi:hypothetical protein